MASILCSVGATFHYFPGTDDLDLAAARVELLSRLRSVCRAVQPARGQRAVFDAERGHGVSVRAAVELDVPTSTNLGDYLDSLIEPVGITRDVLVTPGGIAPGETI